MPTTIGPAPPVEVGAVEVPQAASARRAATARAGARRRPERRAERNRSIWFTSSTGRAGARIVDNSMHNPRASGQIRSVTSTGLRQPVSSDAQGATDGSLLAYRTLREAIVDGRFQPNERLGAAPPGHPPPA